MMSTMNKSGKIVLVVIILSILVVVGFKYKQFFLDKDFSVIVHASCDPATESCFRIACDGECEESSVIFSDGSPYKKIELPHSKAPMCITTDMTCLDFSCSADDTDCTTTYCADDTLEEGEECVIATSSN